MTMSKYFKINLDIGHFTAANSMLLRTFASTTRTSRTCTSRIGSETRARTCRGARATRRCGSAAAAQAEQVADRGLPRVRIQGRRHARRRSEEGARVHARGARVGHAPDRDGPRRSWIRRRAPCRCGAASRVRRCRSGRGELRSARPERRPTRWVFRRRTAATRRSPPIPTCTSCTTRRRTTCTCPSSWRRSPIASTSFRTSRSP